MFRELVEVGRNPIELVTVKGSTDRVREPQVLDPEKLHELVQVLDEPYRTMTIVAMCTGLRVSEVLALRWEHFDFDKGFLLVQKGVVNGKRDVLAVLTVDADLRDRAACVHDPFKWTRPVARSV
jgi:integrase